MSLKKSFACLTAGAAALAAATVTAPALADAGPTQPAAPQLATPQLATPQLTTPLLATPQLAAPQLAPPRLPPNWQFDREESDPAERRWYGWQMIVGYGISDLMLAFAVPTGSVGPLGGTLAVAGLSGHVFVGAITHWSHGHLARGFASLGMTAAGAAVCAGIGLGIGVGAAQHDSNGDGGMGVLAGVILGPAIGGGIGLLAGNIVDVSVLAYDPPAKDSVVTSLRVAPIVAPQRAGLAVSGRF